MAGKRVWSAYRGMWLFALFDLPVKLAEERHEYNRFRTALLKQGFIRLQYSIYVRYCPSEEASAVFRKKVRAALPPDGQVRVLAVTDRQFGKMECFEGKKRKETEKPPEQMALF